MWLIRLLVTFILDSTMGFHCVQTQIFLLTDDIIPDQLHVDTKEPNNLTISSAGLEHQIKEFKVRSYSIFWWQNSKKSLSQPKPSFPDINTLEEKNW